MLSFHWVNGRLFDAIVDGIKNLEGDCRLDRKGKNLEKNQLNLDGGEPLDGGD